MNRIVFLGTAGGRVVVFKQWLASGGLWVEQGGVCLHLDPGPGALVQAVRRKLDPTRLDAIILSHKHLDHSADVNVMIEAMTTGGQRRRGVVLAPRDAYEDDPVVLKYARGYVQDCWILQEGGEYRIGDLSIRAPMRHQHPGEVYGLIFSSPGCQWSYVADTKFTPALAEHYRTDLVVLHTVFLEDRDLYHLSIPDARRFIEAARPRKVVLTHFGATVWRAKPWVVAQRLSEETGVEVVAARDGMTLELPGEDG